jgi:hypothetical protein
MKKPIKENILKVYGREPKTLNELAQCVIEVIESQKNIDSWYNPKKHTIREFKNHKVVNFAWQVSRNEQVSNSHSSPEGYPENWGAKPGLPKGYPGWYGRVWIRYAEEPYSFLSSGTFEQTLTHTGTGGAGAYDGPSSSISTAHWRRYGHTNPKSAYPSINCYSWDFRFYDLDWPEIAKWYEQQQVIHHLGGPFPKKDHYFCWTDPETEHRDNEFLAECAIWQAKQSKKAA